MRRRGVSALALPALLLLTSCAHHVRAPTPDLGRYQAVAPARERSTLLLRALLSYDQLVAALESVVIPPKQLGQRSPLASWSLRVEKRPGVRLRPSGDRLCFAVPFAGHGSVQVFGRAMARTVAGGVEVCARPRLNPNATLSLRDAVVRVVVEQGRIALNSRVLTDQLRKALGQHAGEALRRAVEGVRLPLPQLLAPLARRLTTALPVGRGMCLRPRVGDIVLGQPRIEPGGLRFAAVLEGRPTLERPCAIEPPPRPARGGRRHDAPRDASRRPPTISATLRVSQRPSRLLVPIGLGTARAGEQILAELRKRGPIRWADGHVTVERISLETSRGVVLVRATLRGEARGHVLGIPTTRAVDGEVLVWGRPTVANGRVGLAQVQLSLDLDDKLAALGAALRASALRDVVSRHLSLPVSAVERAARAQVQRLAGQLSLGGRPLPARVRIEQLKVVGARAEARRLVLESRFVGWIVLEPAPLAGRTTSPPSSSNRPQRARPRGVRRP